MPHREVAVMRPPWRTEITTITFDRYADEHRTEHYSRSYRRSPGDWWMRRLVELLWIGSYRGDVQTLPAVAGMVGFRTHVRVPLFRNRKELTDV